VSYDGSKKVVWIALVSNVAIAIAKYAAALATGSSAMLAEAFHSTADTGNQLLLLLGMKRSERPATALHPFGHGKILYFYSLLVAIYIFGVGGAVAVYRGISRLHRPELSQHPVLNYLVLGVGGLFELYSLRISYSELAARRVRGESIWRHILRS